MRAVLGILLVTAVVNFVGCNKQKKEMRNGTKEVKQEMQETGNDLKRGTNKSIRGVKDDSCELVNGKMECAAKKAKHSLQNASDKVEDAAD